jgi:hypothetical protein
MPRKAVIFLSADASLGYGSEPDGSGQKWDNEKTLAVPIEKVWFNFSFEVSLTDQPLNTDIPDNGDRAFFQTPRG